MMATLVHYNNLLHGPSVLGMLNEQRLSGQMCDTVLVVGDQRYQAHRSVLAASSEYFQSLFTRTEADAPKVVHLDFCEADAFEEVLNYMFLLALGGQGKPGGHTGAGLQLRNPLPVQHRVHKASCVLLCLQKEAFLIRGG